MSDQEPTTRLSDLLEAEIEYHKVERTGHTELAAYLSIGILFLSFFIFASESPPPMIIYFLFIACGFDLLLIGFIFWHEFNVRRLVKKYAELSRHSP